MKDIRILGLLITDRIKEAGRTQKVLSRHSEIIRIRLGFHEVSEDVCSRIGLILLQVSGPEESCKMLEEDLRAIGGLEIQQMVFQI